MNKEQQIEEMARVACEHFDCDMVGQPCTKCKTYDKHCYTIHQAEILYNAGYRKTFTSDFASDTQKAFKEGYEKAQDEIARQKKEIEYWKAETKEARKDIDEAVKETAKNIIEKLKEKAHNYYPSIDHYCCSEKAIKLADIDELLKEYEK